MSLQVCWTRRSIIALVALVGLFSTVYHHMSLQVCWLRRSKVALVALVRLLSAVYLQVLSQTGCIGGLIFTLVTFFGFLFTVTIAKKLVIVACGQNISIVACGRKLFFVGFQRCIFYTVQLLHDNCLHLKLKPNDWSRWKQLKESVNPNTDAK